MHQCRKIGMGTITAMLLLAFLPALASDPPLSPSPFSNLWQLFSRPRTPGSQPPPIQRLTCPTELQPLTKVMLRDLPAYMNRLNQRLLGDQSQYGFTYAIAASQPDLMPLPLDSSEYRNPVDQDLHQVFFTVLERQYFGKQKFTQWQKYYWLFLAPTSSGWRVARLFSRLGAYPPNNQPLGAVEDSSQSLTAQAIQLWLRDCRAGSVPTAQATPSLFRHSPLPIHADSAGTGNPHPGLPMVRQGSLK